MFSVNHRRSGHMTCAQMCSHRLLAVNSRPNHHQMLWKEKASFVSTFRVRLVMLFLQATNGNQTHAYDTFSAHNVNGEPAPLGRKFAGEHTRRTNHRTLPKVCAPSFTLTTTVLHSQSVSRVYTIIASKRRLLIASTLHYYVSKHFVAAVLAVLPVLLVPQFSFAGWPESIKWPTTTTSTTSAAV